MEAAAGNDEQGACTVVLDCHRLPSTAIISLFEKRESRSRRTLVVAVRPPSARATLPSLHASHAQSSTHGVTQSPPL